MAESEVIQEFLVALGFKIDQPALQSFEQGIHKAGRAAIGLASAVEGMALTVGLGISRFASNLEQLYFAAQRTGSSAVSLRAFQRTAQDFGASAGEALGSVENLAQSMRMNPGNVALLESLGVHLQRTKDGTYDATDALMQFGNVMRERGYFKPGQFYMAEQYARMFGINERTLLALRNGNFDAEYNRIHGRMQHHGFNKATADAHRFMNSLRNLETVLQAFGAQVEDALQKKLGVNLKQLSAWIETHGPTLATQLVAAASQIYAVATMIARAVGWLIPKFEWVDRATDGWAGKLVALYAILRLIGGLELAGGIARLVLAFGRLGATLIGVRAAATGEAAVSGGGLLGALVPGAILGVGAGWGLDKLFPHNPLAELGGLIGDKLYDFHETFHRQSRALEYFTDQGWTPWQAAGLVANLEQESGLNAWATGDNGRAEGVAQWHAARQAEFERVMGRPLKGSSFMQQLEFVNYEARHDPEYGGRMLANARTASQAARIVSEYFERPAHGRQQAQIRAHLANTIMRGLDRQVPYLASVQAHWRAPGDRGGGAPAISQQTDIHVHGAGDPSQVAQEVAGQQRRVNAEMARNFVTGLR